MNFQMTGATITNLDNVETISAFDNEQKISYDIDEDEGIERQKIQGEPFEIHFDMVSGRTLKMRFEKQIKRDQHFMSIQRTLTTTK